MESLRAQLQELKTRLDRLTSDARAWFDRLNPRERKMVTFVAGAISCFVLFVLLFSFATSASGYRRRTQEKREKLQQVQVLAGTYRAAEQERQAAEQQLSAHEVRLISYIEEKATSAGLEVPSMNPKGFVGIGDGRIEESVVDLSFTDVNLRQLVSFLKSVEGGPGVVKVKSLRIEPHPANNTLTAWTVVATYRMKP